MLSGNPLAQNGHARRRLFSQGQEKMAGSRCPKGEEKKGQEREESEGKIPSAVGGDRRSAYGKTQSEGSCKNCILSLNNAG
ncbi:MAG: hypothetical protein CW346_09625 [Bacillaceae bacterium]|nr:hypothetical protein [Bacillaceae bacterium]